MEATLVSPDDVTRQSLCSRRITVSKPLKNSVLMTRSSAQDNSGFTLYDHDAFVPSDEVNRLCQASGITTKPSILQSNVISCVLERYRLGAPHNQLGITILGLEAFSDVLDGVRL